MQFTIEDYYIVATTFELWLVKGKSTCHAYTNHGLLLKQEEDRVQLGVVPGENQLHRYNGWTPCFYRLCIIADNHSLWWSALCMCICMCMHVYAVVSVCVHVEGHKTFINDNTSFSSLRGTLWVAKGCLVLLPVLTNITIWWLSKRELGLSSTNILILDQLMSVGGPDRQPDTTFKLPETRTPSTSLWQPPAEYVSL